MPGKICPQCGEDYEINQRFCSRDGAVLTSSATEAESLVGTIIAGRYQILRELGEGGMGQVFLAEHLRMQRKCALKVMRPKLAADPDAVSRFNREATNASRIDHPNVAAIFDFGDAENGIMYLAMEFVDGTSLASVLAKSQGMTPSRVSNIVRQIADALQAAHDHGIVHRDLKPANIMLRRTKGGDDMVKLVDFGISKIGQNAAQEVTTSGAIVGTPAYMSPEQVRSGPVDARSDVFSLGLVAFKMLTDRLAFGGESGVEWMAARLSDNPKRLSDVRQGFNWGPELERVMSHVLASNPDDRYASAPEFAREFALAVSSIPLIDEDTTFVLTPARERARTWRQRRPLVLAAAGLAIIGGGAFALWSSGVSPVTAPALASPATTRADTLPKLVQSGGAFAAPTSSAASVIRKGAEAPVFAFPVPTVTIRASSLDAASRDSVAAAVRNELAALETPSARSGIVFRFGDDRSAFAVGDELRFHVRAVRGGYLTIIDVAPDGLVTVLHPSKFIDVGYLASGADVVLPGPADAAFHATLPAGAGMVRAIITAKPLTTKRVNQLATSADDPQLLAKIRRQLERMVGAGDSTWSSQLLRYSIRS